MFFKLLSHFNHVENLLACEISNRHKIMLFHFEFSFCVQIYEKLSKIQKEKTFFFSFSRRSKFSKGKFTHNF